MIFVTGCIYQINCEWKEVYKSQEISGFEINTFKKLEANAPI